MNSVPFTIHGRAFSEVQGILRLTNDCLIIEFRTVDAFFGVLKTSPKEIRLKLSDLETIEYRWWWWFWGRVTLTARSMAALHEVPGSIGPEVTLTVQRKHQLAARELVSNLKLQVLEKQLADMRSQSTLPENIIIPGSATLTGHSSEFPPNQSVPVAEKLPPQVQ